MRGFRLARRPSVWWGRCLVSAVLAAASGAAEEVESRDVPRAAALPVTATQAPSDAAPPAPKPSDKPITTDKGKIGALLAAWWAEGTAAGNVGDFYDNRDRGHSALNIAPYPQLSKVEYTDEERRRGLDWALQGRVLPKVVFGNSSTSSGPTTGGSNARMAYSHPLGLAMLYAAYRSNNLYVYPEHQDHDPGHNGHGGYGDLFPTNTPYLIISQGSSGSDQPFLRAMPPVLAAFRPEVKRRLVETGLLMPTIQAILRRTLKPVQSEDDYFTGKAHPTVMEGAWVDDLKMVEQAHAMRIDDIPPMIQLKVIEEDDAGAGRDFFDLHSSERLCDTPAVIARVWRSAAMTRRMTVSAEASHDLERRPLRFRWVVLRGDPARIRLTPRTPDGPVCDILVRWHERRPVAPGAAIESNRIDIGVFAHNGANWSAPGFVTFFCLDDEARTADDEGRTIDIGYGLGTTELAVPDWAALLELVGRDAAGEGVRLLKNALPKGGADEFLKAAQEYRKARAEADEAAARQKRADEELKKARDEAKAVEQRRDQANSARQKAVDTDADPAAAIVARAEDELKAAQDRLKKAESDAAATRKAADAARKAAADVLTRPRDSIGGGVQQCVEKAVRRLLEDPALLAREAKTSAKILASADGPTRAACEAARKRLFMMGLLKEGPPDSWNLTPLRGPDRLTACEKALLEQYAATLLERLYFGGLITFTYKRNYVDPRLATAKTWRDVYRWLPSGEVAGWTRYDEQGRREFNRWGLLSIETDVLGRCIKARPVKYVLDVPKLGKADLWSRPPLKEITEAGITEYEYADDNDWRGRVKTK